MRNNIVTMLNYDRDITTEHYAGKAIYLNTTRDVTPESTAKKLEIVRGVFSDLEIHDYPELEHNELFTREDMVPVLTDIMKAQLK